MRQKETFKKIFAGTAIIFAILPVVVTFSAILTSLFNKMEWYMILQRYVVPFEARLVAVLLRLVKIKAMVTPESDFAMVLEKGGGEYLPVALEWNCLGWQSMVLFGLTLITGLKGNWKLISRIETLLFGLLGTFLVNLFRMALITSLAYYWNSFAAMIIHDYFAAFIAIIWMVFFWWFVYSFILEEKYLQERITEIQ